MPSKFKIGETVWVHGLTEARVTGEEWEDIDYHELSLKQQKIKKTPIVNIMNGREISYCSFTTSALKRKKKEDTQMSLKKKEAVKETKETTMRFGFEVTGLIKVFGKEREITLKSGKKTMITDNWTNVSRKYGENYVQKSMVVKFAEEYEAPKTTTDIIVTSAFLTLSGGEGFERITLFIKECQEA